MIRFEPIPQPPPPKAIAKPKAKSTAPKSKPPAKAKPETKPAAETKPRGGRPRKYAGEPWTAEGLSRAEWYRRQNGKGDAK